MSAGVISEEAVRALPPCPACAAPAGTRCFAHCSAGPFLLADIHAARRELAERQQRERTR